MLNLSISELIITIPAILVGLTIHELSHAYAALLLGDDTPRRLGRLTLNPIKHVDPLGFILLIVAGFGWAKPVVINRENLKHPGRDDTLIALAGPVSNFVFAILLVIALKAVFVFAPFRSTESIETTFTVFTTFIALNIVLAIFNLLPIPPLDGSHAILNLLSLKNRAVSAVYFKYGSYALIALVVIDRFTSVDLLPIGPIMSSVVNGLFSFFSVY
jgi:Zn-dependent protease